MTGPLPAPGRTGVRITGDYQWLLAWNSCVEVLLDTASRVANPVIAVGVEVDHVGNLDDVVHWRQYAPHSYMQVKYTVDSHTPVNTEYLTKPTGTGGPSILHKIAAAHANFTRDGNPADLCFTTNQAADPTDPLVSGRDARTKLLLPNAGQSSRAHSTARATWAGVRASPRRGCSSSWRPCASTPAKT